MTNNRIEARSLRRGDEFTHQRRRYEVETAERTSRVVKVETTSGATIYLTPDERVGLVRVQPCA